MKDLYIKPEAELLEFDYRDVICGSGGTDPTENPGQGNGDQQDPDWSIFV